MLAAEGFLLITGEAYREIEEHQRHCQDAALILKGRCEKPKRREHEVPGGDGEQEEHERDAIAKMDVAKEPGSEKGGSERQNEQGSPDVVVQRLAA